MVSPSVSNQIYQPNLISVFAQLFRLPMPLIAGLIGCATIFVLDATTPVWKYLLTALVLFCMGASACAINDYWDVEKDRIDHPDRPLPSGQLTMKQVWWSAFILFSLALICTIPLGPGPLALVAISVIVLWHYSHLLPISGILGNIVVAAIGSGIIFLGSLVVHRPLAMLYPAWFIFCYALAKEIIWDAHDAVGDRSLGIFTVANQWGDRVAFTLAWLLLGSLLVSIPLATQFLPMAHPWLFFGTALAVLGTLGGAVFHFQRDRTERAYRSFTRWERLSMALGVLALLATVPPA